MCLVHIKERYKKGKRGKTLIGYKLIYKTDRGYRALYRGGFFDKELWNWCSGRKRIYLHKHWYEEGFHTYANLSDTVRQSFHNPKAVIVMVELKDIRYKGKNSSMDKGYTYISKYMRIIKEIEI